MRRNERRLIERKRHVEGGAERYNEIKKRRREKDI